jgi:hypothetical protein
MRLTYNERNTRNIPFTWRWTQTLNGKVVHCMKYLGIGDEVDLMSISFLASERSLDFILDALANKIESTNFFAPL